MHVEELGVVLFGAVYLLGCIVGAAVMGDHAALFLALAACGVSYVAQSLLAHQAAWDFPGWLLGITYGSWAGALILAVLAGVALVA